MAVPHIFTFPPNLPLTKGGLFRYRYHLSDEKLVVLMGMVFCRYHSGLYFQVLSLGVFFCDAPHLTTSDKKLGLALFELKTELCD